MISEKPKISRIVWDSPASETSGQTPPGARRQGATPQRGRQMARRASPLQGRIPVRGGHFPGGPQHQGQQQYRGGATPRSHRGRGRGPMRQGPF